MDTQVAWLRLKTRSVNQELDLHPVQDHPQHVHDLHQLSREIMILQFRHRETAHLLGTWLPVWLFLDHLLEDLHLTPSERRHQDLAEILLLQLVLLLFLQTPLDHLHLVDQKILAL